MSRTYSRWRCPHCGKEISVNGLARTSHLRKHVREGVVQEIPTPYGFRYPKINQPEEGDHAPPAGK